MQKILLSFTLGVLLTLASTLGADGPFVRPSGAVGDLRMEPKTITLENGSQAEVESGVFLVPENRSQPQSPAISIPFYRLRSTAEAPAPPIFLLAGGPGSSWIDRFENPENYQEIQFYRSLADVVLFDQRGGGQSQPQMFCDDRHQLPLDQPLDLGVMRSSLRAMSSTCRQRWIDAGIDLSGYTTIENARDVLELQAALGYSSMTLIGGSYGSHLALALMREAPEAIHRVVLYGVEGLDQTWDDPGGRLATYERIAGAAESSAELGPSIPEDGLLETLRAVIETLERKPVVVTVGEGDEAVTVMVDAEIVRKVAGFQAGRRSRPNRWPEFILDLHEGDYSFVARGALALRNLRLDDPMHYMMDCASGISDERAKRYDGDSARELLGDINFEYRWLCDAWGAPDMGSDFRAPLSSDIPTLIVHGTWDTSTPLENAREVIEGLAKGHLIEVIGGTHGALYNLYKHWKPMHHRLGAFLRGEDVSFPHSVTLPRLEFSARQ